MRGRKKTGETKVQWSLKTPKSVLMEMDAEAKAKGVTRSEVANGRLQHSPISLTPELLVMLQNNVNLKCEELKENLPEEAIQLVKDVMDLWNRSK